MLGRRSGERERKGFEGGCFFGGCVLNVFFLFLH